MKVVGYWLCAVSALGLTACHQPKQVAAHPAGDLKIAASASVPANPAPAPPVAFDAKAAAPSPTPGHAGATGLHRASFKRSPGAPHAVTGADGARRRSRLGGRSSAPLATGYSAAYRSCMASANGYTIAQANCYSAEFARQGARLDRAYQAALAARSGHEKTRLLETQRAWVSLRDTKCQEEASARGIDVLRESSCRLEMTVQRSDRLQTMAG